MLPFVLFAYRVGQYHDDKVFFSIPISRYKCQDTAIFVAHAQYVYCCRPLPAGVAVSLVSHGGGETKREVQY